MNESKNDFQKKKLIKFKKHYKENKLISEYSKVKILQIDNNFKNLPINFTKNQIKNKNFQWDKTHKTDKIIKNISIFFLYLYSLIRGLLFKKKSKNLFMDRIQICL
jgi:hypothetical protein